MTQVMRRSMSYCQGVGMGRLNGYQLGLRTAIRPSIAAVCEYCGQSHDKSRNHLYDYPIEVDDDLICQICLQPLVDPVDTPCSHTFCYNCVASHLSRSQTCPTDRQPLCPRDVRQSSLLVRKILDKLRVVCPNTAYCDATMPRSSLEKHLKVSCPGSYVRCPRHSRGCPYLGPRIQLEDHIWNCTHGEDICQKTGRKYSIREGVPSVIEIPKGVSDLGLSVSFNEATGTLVVDDIYPGGNAQKDGRLMIRDEIHQIDDQDFTMFTYQSIAQARLALSSISPVIRLVVLRKSSQDYDTYNCEEIEISKHEHRPLGIHLTTHRSEAGVYVHHLMSGSLAEECGRISVGDRILEVDGVDVRHSTVEETATIMTRCGSVLNMIVKHQLVLSGGSNKSSQSIQSSHSGRSSGKLTRSPQSATMESQTHSQPQSQSSSLRRNRVYEEIVSSTGYIVGGAKCIILKKKPDESFGMSVLGGVGYDSVTGEDVPVYISAIKPDSVADKCDKIQRGDIILSINSISLTNKTHIEAVHIIKSLSSNSVIRIEMIQGDDLACDNDGLSGDWRVWLERYMSNRKSPVEYDLIIPRARSQSLGFSIVGGVDSPRGDSPIYIMNINPDSIADKDGRLKCRDQIVSVNKISVHDKKQEEVVEILRKSTGDISLTIIPHEW